VLLVVLGTLVFAFTLVMALLGFTQTYLRSADSYQHRADTAAQHADAVRYALNAIRGDTTIGRAGTSSTWTYDGVAVSCTGDAGSGVAQGSGTTDRLVTCETELINAQVRYFDRGGSAAGVRAELLSWKLLRST
jgi:hypothetical protein